MYVKDCFLKLLFVICCSWAVQAEDLLFCRCYQIWSIDERNHRDFYFFNLILIELMFSHFFHILFTICSYKVYNDMLSFVKYKMIKTLPCLLIDILIIILTKTYQQIRLYISHASDSCMICTMFDGIFWAQAIFFLLL